MPARNSRKQYLENGYYHLYNRGVEKRKIFLDQQDYAVFLSYLKDYLTPKDAQQLHQQLADPTLNRQEKDKLLKKLRLNNFAGEITLLAYCLMPNHFHFLVKQKGSGSIDKFMNSLGTRYSMYFNRKYSRVGSLYQGVYKAVLVTNSPQFLYLTSYIHKQALVQGLALRQQPCSFPEYIGERHTSWIHPEEILLHFTNSYPSLSYRNFVREENNFIPIENLTLE